MVFEGQVRFMPAKLENLLSSLLFAFVCGFTATGLHAQDAPRPVKTMVIENAETVIRRQFFGTVVARQTVDLALQVSGQLNAFPVLEGAPIKNGIVLVEEIDLVRKDISDLNEAIVRACVSRLRPVVLAAGTTILGMAPLLSDAFFVSMALTIMGGLAFASVLTPLAAPVLYRLFFRAAPQER